MHILLIDKSKGLTSHDVVARLRSTMARALGLPNRKVKVGHLGTLDPMATGVLPICVGKVTKLAQYFADDKTYVAHIQLGQNTTTWDAEGSPIINAAGNLTEGTVIPAENTPPQPVTQAHIEQALPMFLGHIEQRVPQFSAVKINGQKLYHAAHEGKLMAVHMLPKRMVDIHQLQLRQFQADTQQLELEVHCGSGTYIRSLAFELGQALGCGAHLMGLVRTTHGRFALAQTTSLENATAQLADTPPDQWPTLPLFQAPQAYLPLPQFQASAMQIQQLQVGMPLTIEPSPAIRHAKAVLVIKSESLGPAEAQLVAVAHFDNGKLRPLTVFL